MFYRTAISQGLTRSAIELQLGQQQYRTAPRTLKDAKIALSTPRNMWAEGWKGGVPFRMILKLSCWKASSLNSRIIT